MAFKASKIVQILISILFDTPPINIYKILFKNQKIKNNLYFLFYGIFMKYLTTPLITLAIIGFTPLANAAEVEEVCAKYRQAFGEWSKSYKVSATLIDGSELKSKTSCYSCYDSFSKYAVMFWSNNGTTVIKLDNRYLSYSGNEGYDQDGKQWELSKGYCY